MVISQKKPENIPLETLNAVVLSLLETFAESPNIFSSNCGNGKKKTIWVFPEVILKTFPWTRRKCKVDDTAEFFLVKVQKWLEKINLFKSYFSLVRSSGHWEEQKAVLTTLLEFVRQKSRISSVNLPKLWKLIFFQKNVLLKLFPWHAKCSFDKPVRNFYSKCEGTYKTKLFSRKKFFLPQNVKNFTNFIVMETELVRIGKMQSGTCRASQKLRVFLRLRYRCFVEISESSLFDFCQFSQQLEKDM